MSMDVEDVAIRLRSALGPEGVITDRQRLRTYECDGLAHYKVMPAIVVLPRTTEQVSAVVRICVAAGVPYVARGSGTGLSGGALPHADGVLIVITQMREINEVDARNQRAVVKPGVINLDVSKAAAATGYYYAPDPSSQQICSIGGNVAENSGGAHCLKYGFTTNHVLGVQLVTPEGDIVRLGGKAPDPPGYDLLGAFVGSEGTLGIATQVTVKLTRTPEAVRTLLAAFATTDEAGAAVSAIIGAGVIPAAIEMMDALAIEAAEEAVHCHYPEGAGAVLIVELDGPAAEVDAQFDAVARHCDDNHAFEIRIAADDAERALVWKGRKSAFAAVGRISPDYIVQDGVIPRTSLPMCCGGLPSCPARAGCGWPTFSMRVMGTSIRSCSSTSPCPGEAEHAEEVSAAILDLCIETGGSITGEHGVGMDKSKYMPRMFTEDDLDTMQLLRCAFDPATLCNPGKIFPTPRLCGEVPGRHKGAHPLQESGLAEVF